MKMKKRQYNFTFKYRIMSCSEDGLLKLPTRSNYGCKEIIFMKDFETMELAHREIEKMQEYGDFLIIPISVVSYTGE